ncbi:SusC/RagA family TonB-linked outer membrane protein [Spirosoma endbachense]|uniref:SusC/RagA family TonB-linked outer membrane protein n=1 Tax=Spirosoma endbachense TaxID=2666025 RepID=UPI001E439DE4|nr:TonB-dependent receptor [Spirosoma endbachense]
MLNFFPIQWWKARRLLAYTGCLLTLFSVAQAGNTNSRNTPQARPTQEIITGTVTDESGQGLPGVSIVVKGTAKGTTTDAQGSYRIGVPDPNAILVFSFVGYITIEETIGSRSTVNLTLKTDDKTLNEVVVVGYGTQTRRNVTGSVAKVDLKQTENLPNTNISQALRGRVAGVQFIDNGRPGQSGSILVRGQRSITASNDPLIILDGIFFNGNLADINPNDIESMEILKDASAAAIYGSRAANGVILVNSRRGATDKPTIRFSTYAGVSNWSHRLKLLSPDRYVQRILDFRQQNGQTSDPTQVASYLQNVEAENYKNGQTVDPFDEISQQGSIQSYNLSISGRSERTSYLFSGAQVYEKGLIYNDNANRTSIRLNLENTIRPWLKVGVSSLYARRDLSGQEGDVQAAFWVSPYGKLYNDAAKTDVYPYPSDDQLSVNPMLYAKLNKNEEIKHNLFANFYAIVDAPFLPELSYRANFSPNYRWEHTYNSSPIYQKYGINNRGTASKYNREDYDWVLENILTYTKQINDKHSFDVTALYGRNHRGYEATYANGATFFTDVLSWNNLNLAQIQTDSSRNQSQEGISSMLRLNYRFMNRYLLTVTARRDGTSVFGANHKYGTFPSAALAWVASDEPFIKSLSFINLLKVRLSYGLVGNQAIGPYQSLSRASTTPYVFGDGGSTSTGVYTSSMQNADLTWETTKSTNLAMDFELFKGRLGGTIEYYNLDTKDLLLYRQLPSPTGFAGVTTNLGATNNKGFELSINSVNLRKGKFEWSSNVLFSTNTNRITHLYGSDTNGDGKEDDDLGNRWFIGQPISVNYDYTLDGVYQVGDEIPTGYKAGFYRIKDINGDGKITPADRSVLSQQQPKYRWGVGNTFRYGNLSLTVFLNAMMGWSQSLPLLETNGLINYPNRPVNGLDADWWTAENKSNTRPALTYTNPLGHDFYQSRDFVRIQDVNLTYQFPSALTKRLKISNLSVYISGKNLYTFTNWQGIDPESGYNTRLSYPTARSVTAGLNLSF